MNVQFSWLRLSGSVVQFLLSILPFLVMPIAPLWILAILIEGVGPWAALLCAGLIVFGDWKSRMGRISLAFAFAGFVLYVLPSVQAHRLAERLPERCMAAFGQTHTKFASFPRPYSIGRLFRGWPRSPVTVIERVYWKKDDESRHLDLYRPSNTSASLPLVIVIHGGSWGGGNKEELKSFNRLLASSGYAVAAVNYRLAPRWPFPAAEADIFHALDYLKAHAELLGVDPTRVVLLGRSAGGQIALSAAYGVKNSAIRGVISLYGPTDLVLAYQKPSWVLDSKKALENYLGGNPNQRSAAYAAASPLKHVGSQTPPTLLIHGEKDPVVWPVHSRLLSHRLEEAQRPHLYLALPNGTHGCEAIASGPSGQLSVYAIRCFLDAILHLP